MPPTPGDLFTLVVVIALGFLFAVAFYESLSERDVVLARAMRIARRLTTRRWIHVLVYVASAFVAIPVLIVVWVSVLELAFFLVGSTDSVASVGLVAAAIVGAARALAYIRHRTSHELAKAVPLSLAVLVITGGSLNLEQKMEAITANPGAGTITIDMLLVLMAIEVGLRVATDGSNAVLAAGRRRRGSESDAGIWETVRSRIRRPIRAAIGAVGGTEEPGGDAGASTPGPAS
jgi:hypothetical protein